VIDRSAASDRSPPIEIRRELIDLKTAGRSLLVLARPSEVETKNLLGATPKYRILARN